MVDKILVIKLAALGDFIQALGPFAAIRKHHSGSRITLLTSKPFVELAHAGGFFDQVLRVLMGKKVPHLGAEVLVISIEIHVHVQFPSELARQSWVKYALQVNELQSAR